MILISYGRELLIMSKNEKKYVNSIESTELDIIVSG